MALFRWIVRHERSELLSRAQSAIDSVGLEIDNEFSNAVNILAREKEGSKVNANARATVTISPNGGELDEFQVEVRSSEPMLKKGTRCEHVANVLRVLLVPC
jgi:hypothetical protein